MIDRSCKLSTRHTIHMKYQALFSVKKKIKKTYVICYNFGWHFKGESIFFFNFSTQTSVNGFK